MCGMKGNGMDDEDHEDDGEGEGVRTLFLSSVSAVVVAVSWNVPLTFVVVPSP